MVDLAALLGHLQGYVSHRACLACLCGTPLTHMAGVLLLGTAPSSKQDRGRVQKNSRASGNAWARFLSFSRLGGRRHAALAGFAWAMWVVSILVSLPMWLSTGPLAQLLQLSAVDEGDSECRVPNTSDPSVGGRFSQWRDVIGGATAASSFIAACFLMQAMLVYEPSEAGPRHTRSISGTEGDSLASKLTNGSWRHAAKRALKRHGPPVAVVFIGLMLSLTGVLLLLSVERMPDLPSRLLYCSLSLVCLIIGASSTHGLGGYLQWGRRQARAGHANRARAGVQPLHRCSSVGPLVRQPRQPQQPLHALGSGQPQQEPDSLQQLLPPSEAQRICQPLDLDLSPPRLPSVHRKHSPSLDLRLSPGLAHPLTPAKGLLRSWSWGELPAEGLMSRTSSPYSFTAVSLGLNSSEPGRDRETEGAPDTVTGTAAREPAVAAKESKTGREGDITGRMQFHAGMRPTGAGADSRSVQALEDEQSGSHVSCLLSADCQPPASFTAEHEVVFSWSFFQPFAGGTMFVVCQAVGWAMFAVSMVLIGTLAQALVAGMVNCLRCWVLGAGALMMGTQVVLALSLLTWQTAGQGNRILHVARSNRLLAALRSYGGLKVNCRRGVVAVQGMLWHQINTHGPIFVSFLPMQIFFSLWALTFAYCPTHCAAMVWLTLLPAFYIATLLGEPQHTGAHTWPALRKWYSNNMQGSLTAWYGSVEVVADWEDPYQDEVKDVEGHVPAVQADGLTVVGHPKGAPQAVQSLGKSKDQGTPGEGQHDPVITAAETGRVQPGSPVPTSAPASSAAASLASASSAAASLASALSAAASSAPGASVAGDVVLPASKPARHILAFHPHGLFPSGACWLPMLPAFRRLMPHITPITLTASVLYYVPAIKELSLWLGFRQVSRRTFVRALHDAGSVIMCPGGQAELVYTYASHLPYASVGVGAAFGQSGAGRESRSGTAGVAPGSAPDAVLDIAGTSAAGAAARTASAAAGTAGAAAGTADRAVGTAGVAAGTAGRAVGTAGVAAGTADRAVGTASATSAAANTAAGTLALEEESSTAATQGCLTIKAGQELATAGPPGTATAPVQKPCHSPAGEMVIYTGHKGFVRLAIEQQASLVPVLALGEVLQLRNLIHLPRLQRWTYKRLGFPFPYIVCGRWGVSPLPARVPLVYVLGKPIEPPPLSAAGGPVPQEEVDALHAKFYGALEAMFYRHRHRHPAFADAKLTLLHNHVG